MTKNDRTKLIAVLAHNLPLFVHTVEDRKQLARRIADGLDLPFVDHFVEACVATSDRDN